VNSRGHSRASAYTLVEVLISMSLATIILASVLGSFLMLGRSGINLGNYNEMESEARLSLEQFGQDVRQASDIMWVSGDELTLSFPAAKTPNRVTYKHDGGDFIRQLRAPDNTLLAARTLINGVTEFELIGYNIAGEAISDAATIAEANRETKQLQLSLKASRSRATVATATNTVLSARFILRNKKVTF
jgi:type II secretory pathway pseudopilin PulG